MRNDTTQKYDTPAAISATLDIPAGRIQFIAADRADTTVEIRPEDTAKSSDVKAAERIEVAYSDGILRIQGAEATSRILGNSGSVDVTVQLPAGSRIEAKAAVAEFRGVGQLGDVTFEGATGSVKLDETTSAHITLQSGDVSVGLLRGPAQISTRQGSLRIDEATGGTVTLRTEQGDITVGAAGDASASLDAATTYGRIHNSFRNADGAGAVLTVHATTAHGDITARSL